MPDQPTIHPNVSAALSALRKLELTDLENEFLRREGFSRSDLTDLAREWSATENVFKPEEVTAWIMAARCIYAPHAARLKDAGIAPAAAHDLPAITEILNDSLRAVDYDTLNRDEKESTDPLDRAVTWKCAGFNETDVVRWTNAGAFLCHKATVMRDAGVVAEEAKRRVPSGSQSMQSHARRVCQGWARMDDALRAIAVERATAQVRLPETLEWRAATEHLQKRFKDNPLSTEERALLQKDGLDPDPKELARVWLNMGKDFDGFTANDVRLYAGHYGLISPVYAAQLKGDSHALKSLTFLPGLVQLMRVRPLSDAEAAMMPGKDGPGDGNTNPIARACAWIKAGFSFPDRVAEWLHAGCFNPATAKLLSAEGLIPQDATVIVKTDVYGPQNYGYACAMGYSFDVREANKQISGSGALTTLAEHVEAYILAPEESTPNPTLGNS